MQAWGSDIPVALIGSGNHGTLEIQGSTFVDHIKSHIVYVGDRRVHYRRAGTGPAVVMLHLSPSWAKSLDGYTAAFAEHGAAIAIDTPGYGLSDPLDIESPDIGDFADALRDTLDPKLRSQ